MVGILPHIRETKRRIAVYLAMLNVVLAAALTAVVCAPVASASELPRDEASVRAALVGGILRYTLWEQFIDSQQAVTVCLAGQPPSQLLLQTSLNGQILGQYKVSVLVEDPVDVEVCHALVVGSNLSRAEVKAFAKAANEHSTLTICDACNPDVASELMIDLIVRRQKLRFSVNLKLIKAAGIALNSSLLELAAEVRR